MKPLDELESALEVLGRTIRARDRSEAIDAFAVFFALCMSTFGAGSDFFDKISPIIEKLKQHIKGEQFDDAIAISDAFLVRVRQTKVLQK